MPHPHFLILHVDSPAASADFYAGLLDQKPVESSPTFVMFALRSGLMLGLWARHTVLPAAEPAAGGSELALTVDTSREVDAMYEAWKQRGVAMLLPPTDMDFGRCFVGIDLDGHWLRVFAPS